MLARAAAWLREHRLEVAALEVRECAKPWPEADADVCEAIDFLEYYARGAVELEAGAELAAGAGRAQHAELPAARRRRGHLAVELPGRDPAAGWSPAGLATGNAVVLKPAEQAPGCAFVLVRALREAGVPADALALLPGEGDVGAALVADPRVHTIAFTGSSAVGLEIMRIAADDAGRARSTSSAWSPRWAARTAVIVDADADLDEVVPALVAVGVQLRGPEVLGRRARALPRGDPRRAARAARGRGRGAGGRARQSGSTSTSRR